VQIRTLLIDTDDDDGPCQCDRCKLRRVMVPPIVGLITDPVIELDGGPRTVLLMLKCIATEVLQHIHENAQQPDDDATGFVEEFMRDVYSIAVNNGWRTGDCMTPDKRTAQERGIFEKQRIN
jgi:hypothetical protein